MRAKLLLSVLFLWAPLFPAHAQTVKKSFAEVQAAEDAGDYKTAANLYYHILSKKVSNKDKLAIQAQAKVGYFVDVDKAVEQMLAGGESKFASTGDVHDLQAGMDAAVQFVADQRRLWTGINVQQERDKIHMPADRANAYNSRLTQEWTKQADRYFNDANAELAQGNYRSAYTLADNVLACKTDKYNGDPRVQQIKTDAVNLGGARVLFLPVTQQGNITEDDRMLLSIADYFAGQNDPFFQVFIPWTGSGLSFLKDKGYSVSNLANPSPDQVQKIANAFNANYVFSATLLSKDLGREQLQNTSHVAYRIVKETSKNDKGQDVAYWHTPINFTYPEFFGERLANCTWQFKLTQMGKNAQVLFDQPIQFTHNYHIRFVTLPPNTNIADLSPVFIDNADKRIIDQPFQDNLRALANSPNNISREVLEADMAHYFQDQITPLIKQNIR